VKGLLAIVVVAATGGCATVNQEGTSLATAVVIDVAHQAETPIAERAWIEKHYPGARPLESSPSTKEDSEFVSLSHSLFVYEGKSYSSVVVQLRDGSERTFYFDISSSFGR